MLVTTMNDVPGATITSVIGEVSGLTVRARNIGAQIGAGFKALGGGELKASRSSSSRRVRRPFSA